jgi:ribonuclease HII
MRSPSFDYEDNLIAKGYGSIAGIDEVGRGCLAGPVVAGAVLFNKAVDRSLLTEINDSKKLSEIKRNKLSSLIYEVALMAETGFATSLEVDHFGIVSATKLAMKRALDKSPISIDYLLIDAVGLDHEIPSQSIIKGDELSFSIAAASIVAKVKRDEHMKQMSVLYKGYGFESNKGYGTKFHLQEIDKLGICEIHRKSFNPIKSMVN